MSMWEDFMDIILPVILMLFFGVGGLFGSIFVAAHFYGQYQCTNYQVATSKETKFVPFDTCYVKTKDGWQRWDEYKLRAAASEGLSGVRDAIK